MALDFVEDITGDIWLIIKDFGKKMRQEKNEAGGNDVMTIKQEATGGEV